MSEQIEVKQYICSNCGEMTDKGQKKQINSSNGCSNVGCLLILGLCLLPVYGLGLILIIIALFVPMGNKYSDSNICPHCKAENVLVSSLSPVGIDLLHKYHSDIENLDDKINMRKIEKSQNIKFSDF